MVFILFPAWLICPGILSVLRITLIIVQPKAPAISLLDDYSTEFVWIERSGVAISYGNLLCLFCHDALGRARST